MKDPAGAGWDGSPLFQLLIPQLLYEPQITSDIEIKFAKLPLEYACFLVPAKMKAAKSSCGLSTHYAIIIYLIFLCVVKSTVLSLQNFDIPGCGKIIFEPTKLWYIWKNEQFWVKLWWWLPSRGDRWQVRQRGEELTLRWTKNYTMHNCSELKTAQCTTAVNWTPNTAVNTHCRLQYNASAL